ncbi:MAG: BrnT family toxin, partial [Zoogloeaceae bacterium]|nr:BrnT family toxin [Zoogloeaceae bacterium]
MIVAIPHSVGAGESGEREVFRGSHQAQARLSFSAKCVIIRDMDFDFDPAKDAINRKKHQGISLMLAADLDWDEAVTWPDDRFDYGEPRLNATVSLGDTLYRVVYVERGETLRII